jgi:hypothetical protein
MDRLAKIEAADSVRRMREDFERTIAEVALAGNDAAAPSYISLTAIAQAGYVIRCDSPSFDISAGKHLGFAITPAYASIP